MEEYDVVIAGAGPAGGQCARELSAHGKKVLLVERNHDFSVNSYSSAGAPNEIMTMFGLPEAVVGSHWNKILIHSSNQQNLWEQKEHAGVIMDFMKLRTFLAEEARKNGARIEFGLSCQDYQNRDGAVIAAFKRQTSKELKLIKTKILVDATGCERHVLAKKLNFQGNSFPSTGIEYLVQVNPEIYDKWSSCLSLFIGQSWMPQGYSWIFPMEPGKLKIGVGRYFQNDQIVPHKQSYTYYLNLLMEKCLGSIKWPILDKHGKTIVYTYGRGDPHFDGNVIAIGDAVSTINPLAFEGIRHAMAGARIGAKHILNKLDGNPGAFEEYVKELHHHFGFAWKLCEHLMKVIFREPRDENIDLIIQAWSAFSFEELLSIAFNYKLFPIMKFLARYSLLSAKHKLRLFKVR